MAITLMRPSTRVGRRCLGRLLTPHRVSLYAPQSQHHQTTSFSSRSQLHRYSTQPASHACTKHSPSQSPQSPIPNTKPCTSHERHSSPSLSPAAQPTTWEFWTSSPTWSRARLNTLRCLVGCTTGDFAAMWYLQSTYPDLSMIYTMSISMTSGILTSIVLETLLLHYGHDSLPWRASLSTATGMSMISMLAMEAAENGVDYALTGGVVDLQSATFWAAATAACFAGWCVPLPWNYWRLRRWGVGCH